MQHLDEISFFCENILNILLNFNEPFSIACIMNCIRKTVCNKCNSQLQQNVYLIETITLIKKVCWQCNNALMEFTYTLKFEI